MGPMVSLINIKEYMYAHLHVYDMSISDFINLEVNFISTQPAG